MKFRKKPVVIEAIKYQAEFGNNRVMNWLAQQGADVTGWLFFDGEITIPTLEGRMKAVDGDWIIRGVKGEFYPCKPDIFAATYDEVPLAAVSVEELKRAAVEIISDEANAAQEPLKIYHCEDCGCRVAAQILNGPTGPMPHHYLAAGGGEPFLGCCPICGDTGFHDLSLNLKPNDNSDSPVPEHTEVRNQDHMTNERTECKATQRNPNTQSAFARSQRSGMVHSCYGISRVRWKEVHHRKHSRNRVHFLGRPRRDPLRSQIGKNT